MIDTPLGWGLLFGFGLFTGTLAGILGIGGGLLNVPALTLAGATTLQAAATSLIGVLLSATSGSLRNLQTGSLNWRVALILGGFGLLSAQVGSWLGANIPDAFLSLGFAVLALTTIYLMGLKRSLSKQAEEAGAQRNKESEGSGEAGDAGEARYRFVPTMGIGVVAGLLSGLFGVGGGAVMVPLQMLALNEPIKTAVRTSLGAIVAIASSALIRQSIGGHVLWIPGLCLGAGAIIGAQFGTRLLPKLSSKTITTLFRLLLLGLSSYMTFRGIKALIGN